MRSISNKGSNLWTLGVGVVALAMGLASYVTTGSGAVPDGNWGTNLDQALREAQTQNSLVLVDVYADWCGPCKHMADTTFKDKRVIQALKAFVPVKLNADQNQAVLRKYQAEFIPLTLILTPDGKVLARYQGYLDADGYLQLLNSAQKAYNQTQADTKA